MGFVPTEDWMEEKYQEMNGLLFNGELGDCQFSTFTTGKGSQGGVLGWFKITGSNIKGRRSTRRMFYRSWQGEVDITRDNFVYYCQPKIELNANYHGKEESFLETLVHEMCHYYTYMNGFMPRQSHGREFKQACAMVQVRSNGRFTIQRVATSEQMAGLELSDEIKEKKKKRVENRKAKTTILIYWDKDGKTKLVTTTEGGLATVIKAGNYRKLLISNDGNLFDFLYSKGYRSNIKFRKRGWAYWDITGKDWLNSLDEYNVEIYDGEVNGKEETPAEPQKQDTPQTPKKIFSVKTNKGVIEIPFDGVYYAMFKKLKERLPNLSDDALRKLITNPKNYRVVSESRFRTKDVIREVIEEFISNDDDSISIDPNENLGLRSPMENDV